MKTKLKRQCWAPELVSEGSFQYDQLCHTADQSAEFKVGQRAEFLPIANAATSSNRLPRPREKQSEAAAAKGGGGIVMNINQYNQSMSKQEVISSGKGIGNCSAFNHTIGISPPNPKMDLGTSLSPLRISGPTTIRSLLYDCFF